MSEGTFSHAAPPHQLGSLGQQLLQELFLHHSYSVSSVLALGGIHTGGAEAKCVHFSLWGIFMFTWQKIFVSSCFSSFINLEVCIAQFAVHSYFVSFHA